MESPTPQPPNGSAPPGPGPSGPPSSRPSPTGGGQSPVATPFRSLSSIDDPSGDARLNGPRHSDLITVSIEDDGTDARLSVVMNGDIPGRLGQGESMGVGIDLYQDSEDRESDYQLFAEGSADGWFAYLQGPGGFVDFPGRFEMGGNRLAFRVPWASLGNMRTGSFSCFSDWTDASQVVAQAAEDHAPDTGRATFTR